MSAIDTEANAAFYQRHEAEYFKGYRAEIMVPEDGSIVFAFVGVDHNRPEGAESVESVQAGV